ncbi:MAG: hypothetical protein LBF78_08800 [Treponema sp.]|jgi:hypothetical protein|nr:hypothetical protein [Treponema sp.]
MALKTVPVKIYSGGDRAAASRSNSLDMLRGYEDHGIPWSIAKGLLPNPVS